MKVCATYSATAILTVINSLCTNLTGQVYACVVTLEVVCCESANTDWLNFLLRGLVFTRENVSEFCESL